MPNPEKWIFKTKKVFIYILLSLKNHRRSILAMLLHLPLQGLPGTTMVVSTHPTVILPTMTACISAREEPWGRHPELLTRIHNLPHLLLLRHQGRTSSRPAHHQNTGVPPGLRTGQTPCRSRSVVPEPMASLPGLKGPKGSIQKTIKKSTGCWSIYMFMTDPCSSPEMISSIISYLLSSLVCECYIELAQGWLVFVRLLTYMDCFRISHRELHSFENPFIA